MEHNTLDDITTITITAGRWFQKSYGNTYHRVKINILFDKLINSASIQLDSGIHYGYGEQWDQTALELFTKHFNVTVPKYDNGVQKTCYLTHYAKLINAECVYQVVDYDRERDLKKF